MRRGGAADLTSTSGAASDWYWAQGGSEGGGGKAADPIIVAGNEGSLNVYTGQMALAARPVHGAAGGHSDGDGFGGRGAAAPLLHAAATIRPHTTAVGGREGATVPLGAEALRRTGPRAATVAYGAARGSGGAVPGIGADDDGTWRALGYRSKGRVDADLPSRRPATARVIDPSIDPDAAEPRPRVRNLWATNPDLLRPRAFDIVTGRSNVMAATTAAAAPGSSTAAPSSSQ